MPAEGVRPSAGTQGPMHRWVPDCILATAWFLGERI